MKNLPAMQETGVWLLGWEDPLEEETATHSSILAWRIPWTKKPGGLQPMASQVRHNLATKPPPPPGITKSYHIAILASDFLFRNKVYQSRLVPLSAPSLPSSPPCSETTTILKLFLYPSCWHFYSFKTHIFINNTKSCFMGFKIYINGIRL